MITVIPEACEFTPDRSSAKIVIESDSRPFTTAIEELQATDVVRMAQSFAASNGCTPASLNGTRPSPYAVNSEGVPLENVRGANNSVLPVNHPLMQPVRYRIDITVTRPIL